MLVKKVLNKNVNTAYFFCAVFVVFDIFMHYLLVCTRGNRLIYIFFLLLVFKMAIIFVRVDFDSVIYGEKIQNETQCTRLLICTRIYTAR